MPLLDMRMSREWFNSKQETNFEPLLKSLESYHFRQGQYAIWIWALFVGAWIKVGFVAAVLAASLLWLLLSMLGCIKVTMFCLVEESSYCYWLVFGAQKASVSLDRVNEIRARGCLVYRLVDS